MTRYNNNYRDCCDEGWGIAEGLLSRPIIIIIMVLVIYVV